MGKKRGTVTFLCICFLKVKNDKKDSFASFYQIFFGCQKKWMINWETDLSYACHYCLHYALEIDFGFKNKERHSK